MILRRLEGSRFSEVARVWEGLTVAVIACGPSLTGYQVEAVWLAHEADRLRCIAVNDAYLWASFADVHYAADSHWHKWHSDGIAKPKLGFTAEHVRARWAAFGGEKCTIESSGSNVTDQAVHMLRNRDHPNHGNGLSLDPQVLVTGRNSGFQALNLAILAGAKRVLLLGFDGAQNAEGRDHFHGGHPRPTPVAAYPLYRQAMSAAQNAILEAGVEVINCAPGSQIDAFARMDLGDALNWSGENA